MFDFLETLRKNGWSPHEGQLAYLKSDARFRVLACGRRWGKTDAAAAEITRQIATHSTGRQIAIAPTLAQARIVFDRVKCLLAMVGVTFSTVATPYPTLRVHDGSGKDAPMLHVFDARSGHEAKSLRGYGATHILIDEAAYIPESVITEVAMPMLAANDGRMTLISTPRGRSFFYRFYQMGVRAENGFWSRTSPSWENPLVSQEYIELQKEILSDRVFRTEYGAEFLDSNTTVFASDAIDSALQAVRNSIGPTVVGVDWARYADYTAAVAIKGTRNDASVVGVDRWSGMRWSRIVSNVAAFASAHGAGRVVCDVTGVGDPVTEQLRLALPNHSILGFRFTRTSKVEIVEHLVWMFERGSLSLPACPDLLRELEHFEAVSDETGGISYRASAGMNDDLVCALAMACSELPHSRELRVLTRSRGE